MNHVVRVAAVLAMTATSCGRISFGVCSQLGSCFADCADGEKNGDETDRDCGGGCAACSATKQCNSDGDCVFGFCDGGQCSNGFPAVMTNYRSIGSSSGVIHDTGTVSVVAPSRVLTFSDDLPVAVGVGDAVLLGSEVLHITEVRGVKQVVVDQLLPDAQLDVTYSVKRAYNDPQDWEDSRQGDLVGESRREVGILRNDGIFLNQMLTISGSTTNKDHYLSLVVDPREHHRGIAGAGTTFDGGEDTRVGIEIEDAFTHIRGLTLQKFVKTSPIGGEAAILVVAPFVVLEELLIYDFADPDSDARGIRTTFNVDRSTDASMTIRNSILYGGDVGILVSDVPGHHATIEHTTVYNMTSRGLLIDNSAPTLATNVTNSIFMSSGLRDIQVNPGGVINQLGNMSSDATAEGLPSQSVMNQFVSTIPGAEDLHLHGDSSAVNAGVDLSASVSVDIDGDTRPQDGTSDIGADERTPL